MAIKRARIEKTVLLMQVEWSAVCRTTGVSPSNDQIRESLRNARSNGLDVPVVLVDNTINLMRGLLEGEIEFIS